DLSGQPAARVKARVVEVTGEGGPGWRGGLGGLGAGRPMPPGLEARFARQTGLRFPERVKLGGWKAWPAPLTADADGRFRLGGFGRGQKVCLFIDDERFAAQDVVLEIPDRDPPAHLP